MPPDQLLKTLIQVLGDQKHPIRKHPQIFPMFSRISKQEGSTQTLNDLKIS